TNCDCRSAGGWQRGFCGVRPSAGCTSRAGPAVNAGSCSPSGCASSTATISCASGVTETTRSARRLVGSRAAPPWAIQPRNAPDADLFAASHLHWQATRIAALALSASVLAEAIQLAGMLIEPWLFFAEATHTVTLIIRSRTAAGNT